MASIPVAAPVNLAPHGTVLQEPASVSAIAAAHSPAVRAPWVAQAPSTPSTGATKSAAAVFAAAYGTDPEPAAGHAIHGGPSRPLGFAVAIASWRFATRGSPDEWGQWQSSCGDRSKINRRHDNDQGAAPATATGTARAPRPPVRRRWPPANVQALTSATQNLAHHRPRPVEPHSGYPAVLQVARRRPHAPPRSVSRGFRTGTANRAPAAMDGLALQRLLWPGWARTGRPGTSSPPASA